MEIDLPNSGSAAPLFYGMFESDPIVRIMEFLLKPGMTMVDVGSHVGAYALAAAKLVGATGIVHAIEPQPDLADLIRLNAGRMA